VRQRLLVGEARVEAQAHVEEKARADARFSATAASPKNKQIGNILYAPRKVEDVTAKELRAMADTVQRTFEAGVTAIVSVTDGKAALVVKVSDDLKESVSAVELLRAGVAELGGKGGGGRPDFAQGGGPDGTRAEAALEAIQRALASQPAAAE
jgi:alanyl-tRNA synthetase